MKLRILVAALFVMVACPCVAETQYQTAIVVRMQLVPCSGAEPVTFANMMAGTGKSSDPGVCREYMLRTNKVVYHIRTRKDMLLPVGEEVRFRLAKKEILVRYDDSDEFKFFVASMAISGEEPSPPPATVRMCLDPFGNVAHCAD